MNAFFCGPTARGLLRLTGRDRQSFLQGMVTNDVLSLAPSEGCYAFQLDATGHVLADLLILCDTEALLVDIEPGFATQVAETLDRYLIMEKCRIAEVSATFATFLLGGTDLDRLTGSFFGMPVSDWAEGYNTSAPLVGTDVTVRLAAVRAVPGASVRAYVPLEAADTFTDAMKTTGARTVAADDIDQMRIAAGIPRFGVDIDAKVLALETGQTTRAVSFRKGCYIGQEIVARIDARGHTNRIFAGFLADQAAELASPGAKVMVDGVEAGRITSSAHLPDRSGLACLGYIRNAHATAGTPVNIDGVGSATLAALPFMDSI